MKTIRRSLMGLLFGVLLVWALLSFFTWIYCAVISPWLPPPSRFALPWVDLNDFVETTDGRVFIDLPFQHRVGCFDRKGNLISYLPSPNTGKDTELAAGTNGYVYYRQQNNVYTLTSTWEIIAVTKHEKIANRTWELGQDWLPRYAPHRENEPPHDRPVEAGEVLFSDVRAWNPVPQREFFRCSDGSTLWRATLALERRLSTREVVAVYSSPWYVKPFGTWGLASLCLMALIAMLAGKFRSTQPTDLVIDADGSLQFRGEPVSVNGLREKLDSLPPLPDGGPAPILILRRYDLDNPPQEAIQAIEVVIRTGRFIDMRDNAKHAKR